MVREVSKILKSGQCRPWGAIGYNSVGMDLVYLDNNATTRPAPQVVEAMLPFLMDLYGNPSSVHRFGQRSRAAIDEARVQMAGLIGCSDREVIFTAGGTESINTAIRGLLASRLPRKLVVTTTVEHSAVRELCRQLEREGAEIVEVPVDQDGELDMDRLAEVVTDETALVTTMWANNETGVLFDVDKIGRLCRSRGVPFHCDGTQAVGKILVDVKTVPIDVMSFAAHKFHGPKGIGGLFVRRGVRMRPLLIGGPQERNRRGGTENVPGIVGMGVAAELARESLPMTGEIAQRRDRLENSILLTIDDSHRIGRVDRRLPNTTNIGFARLEAEAILLLLSEQGVCASAGSACSSGSLEPSPVILAMGIDQRIAHGAIRFSLSRYTTDAEIDRTLAVLPAIIARLRKVLPVGAS
jgi:cysteine desulfurase